MRLTALIVSFLLGAAAMAMLLPDTGASLMPNAYVAITLAWLAVAIIVSLYAETIPALCLAARAVYRLMRTGHRVGVRIVAEADEHGRVYMAKRAEITGGGQRYVGHGSSYIAALRAAQVQHFAGIGGLCGGARCAYRQHAAVAMPSLGVPTMG